MVVMVTPWAPSAVADRADSGSFGGSAVLVVGEALALRADGQAVAEALAVLVS